DGIPLNDPFGGWVYWGRTPVEAVKRVELVQGGESSLYGSDALGGVINVIERNPRDTAFSASFSGGNESTLNGSLFASAAAKGWGLRLGVEAFTTDGYVLVDDDRRGAVDTKAAAKYSTTDIQIERLLGDHGRAFIGGSLFSEDRKNGTPLQTNDTYIRQLDAGI